MDYGHVAQNAPGGQEYFIGGVVIFTIVHVTDVGFVVAGQDDNVLEGRNDGDTPLFVHILDWLAVDHIADHPDDDGLVFRKLLPDLFKRLTAYRQRGQSVGS